MRSNWKESSSWKSSGETKLISRTGMNRQRRWRNMDRYQTGVDGGRSNGEMVRGLEVERVR